VTVRSLDGRAVPLQVDGDHIGDAEAATFSVRAAALRVVS
jgi:diacylglycerol kinase family enzyme